MAAQAVRSNRVMALSPVAKAIRSRYIWQGGGGIASQPPQGTSLDLGDLEQDIGVVLATSDLLNGITDPDGDTLSVTSFTVATGSATITGSAPWTLTPTGEGAGTAIAVISDGNGGTLNRTISWTGYAPQIVEPVTYTRLSDYQGVYRRIIANVGSHIGLPTYTYTASVDTLVVEFGTRCETSTPYNTTVEDSALSMGATVYRDKIIRKVDGSVTITSTTNSTEVVLAPAGSWPLNEICRFKITFSPTTIALEKMDVAGVYQSVNSIARGSFGTFIPQKLLGTSRGYNGVIYYFGAVLNGTPVYDFRFDEMTFETPMKSAHDASVVAIYSLNTDHMSWKDDTPESLAPQPDLVMSGTLVHGNTLTITSPTETFTGGMPTALIYDDMVGRSGNVGLAATIGSFSLIDDNGVTPTYKTGGPGGRPYVYRLDGASGERLARHWIPGGEFDEVFVSRLLRVPTGYAWPGATNAAGAWPVVDTIPSDSTWKDTWALHADDAGGSGSDLCLGTHSGGYSWTQSGNTPHQGTGVAAPGTFNLQNVHALGEWNHVDNYARYNPADPNNSRHVMQYCSSKAKNAQAVSFGSVLAVIHDYNKFQLVIDGAYVQSNPLARAEAAEVYMAVGPNAPCRVVLGNSVRWEYCTKKSTCPPLAWNGSQIQVRCGMGTINPSVDPVYLYIIGPDGIPMFQYGKKVN